MATIEFDGFLKAYCRIWSDTDLHQSAEESLEYFRKSSSDFDTVF